MKQWKNLVKFTAISLTISATVFIVWLYFRTTPEPTPRDLKILIEIDDRINMSIISLEGNILEAIVFQPVLYNLNDNNIGIGGPVNVEGHQMVDDDLLNLFSETAGWIERRRTMNGFYGNLIMDRWSTELTEEQLNEIWLKIGDVVENYQEPSRLFVSSYSARTTALIDGEFYSGMLLYHEDFRSSNYKFSRRERKYFAEVTDMNLIKLTLHLADLIPISLRW